MERLFADLRYGLRLMRRSPVFTLVTIGTLALGIGANTAIYSVVDSVLLRGLPLADPDRLVMVWEDASHIGFARNTPAPANYFDWREQNRVFTDIAATRGAIANLTTDGPPEQVLGRRVTANFFTVLGVQPALGRAFTAAEDELAAPVVVISHGLWRRRYNADPRALGTTVTMSGVTRTIIGVMPAGFVFRNREVDFWTSIAFTPAERATRQSHFLNVVGRLKPDVSLEQARSEMAAIAARLEKEYPATNTRLGSAVVSVTDDALGDTRLELLALMAAAGCVLLIACANLAGLLLSRAVSRRSEMAVRVALGASGSRLVGQLLVEGIVLSTLGGALGLALAPAGVAVLEGLVPAGLPSLAVSRLDSRVLAFAAVASLVTGVLFSLLPALQAARTSQADTLQQAGRAGVGAGRTFTRDVLVVGQVAVALVLLAAAGLMLRTLANLRATDLGFDPERLLTMQTSLPAARYQDVSARRGFYQRVIDGVIALPGVEAAAYGSTLPFMSIGNTNGYVIEGQTLPPGDAGDALFRSGTAEYLKTLGARLVEGRLLDERDQQDPPTVVINETFASRYWPGQSAIGHRLRFGGADAPWRTIVGVVRDVRERGYELEMKPGVYSVFGQVGNAWTPEFLVVRGRSDLSGLVAPIRQIVAGVDPEQPVALVRTMDEILNLNVVDRRQQTVLLGTFASLALLLTAIGLFGVLSYAVTSRKREIGLRMALGASRGSVVKLVVARGAALTVAGLLIGAVLAWLTTGAIGTLLYGVRPNDPVTFTAVLALLATVALASCGIPALRAARLEPMEALRED